MRALLLAAAMTASAEPGVLRVMTYNAHSCKGWDRRVVPARIAAVIARYAPDVVALQEVRVGRVEAEPAEGGRKTPAVGEPPLPPPAVIPARRPGEDGAQVPFTDQPRAIAAALGMHSVFYPLVRFAKEDYGIAVLSRHPMRLVRAERLPSLPGRKDLETRGALWVELDVDGRKVQLLNTHLGLNARERAAQAAALAGPDWLGAPAFRAPFLVCGDLNSGPDGEPYKTLSSLAVDPLGAKARKTFPSLAPLLRFDYVFVSSGAAAGASPGRPGAKGRLASDHLPAAVDVSLP